MPRENKPAPKSGDARCTCSDAEWVPHIGHRHACPRHDAATCPTCRVTARVPPPASAAHRCCQDFPTTQRKGEPSLCGNCGAVQPEPSTATPTAIAPPPASAAATRTDDLAPSNTRLSSRECGEPARSTAESPLDAVASDQGAKDGTWAGEEATLPPPQRAQEGGTSTAASAAETAAAAAIGERLRSDFERIYAEEAPTMTERERALARRLVDSIVVIARETTSRLASATETRDDFGRGGEATLSPPAPQVPGSTPGPTSTAAPAPEPRTPTDAEVANAMMNRALAAAFTAPEPRTGGGHMYPWHPPQAPTNNDAVLIARIAELDSSAAALRAEVEALRACLVEIEGHWSDYADGEFGPDDPEGVEMLARAHALVTGKPTCGACGHEREDHERPPEDPSSMPCERCSCDDFEDALLSRHGSGR